MAYSVFSLLLKHDEVWQDSVRFLGPSTFDRWDLNSPMAEATFASRETCGKLKSQAFVGMRWVLRRALGVAKVRQETKWSGKTGKCKKVWWSASNWLLHVTSHNLEILYNTLISRDRKLRMIFLSWHRTRWYQNLWTVGSLSDSVQAPGQGSRVFQIFSGWWFGCHFLFSHILGF